MKAREGIDYFLRVIPFPKKAGPIPAMTVLNDDGTFSVYVNARVPLDVQFEALDHEVKHIENGDFYGAKDILDVEEHLRRGA